MDKNHNSYYTYELLTPHLTEITRERNFWLATTWRNLQDSLQCNCCGQMTVRFAPGGSVYGYGKGLDDIVLAVCSSCDAYVGCHEDKDAPKGTLAGYILRSLRKECHALFDPLWNRGNMTRTEAYSWLTVVMGMPKHKAHFGLFNEKDCELFRSLMRSRKEWDLDFAKTYPSPDLMDAVLKSSGWDALKDKVKDTAKKRRLSGW